MPSPSYRTERALIATLVALAGCPKAPPELVAEKSDVRPGVDAGAPLDAAGAQLEDGGLLRLPDWDLDPTDAARDLASRYVVATKRYGEKTRCVSATPSKEKDGQYVVEVRDDLTKCPDGGSALRDVFVVDMKTQRLSIGDPTKHAVLAPWPDGSAPGDAAHEVEAFNRMKDWPTPLLRAFNGMGLSPFRVELYGRGTYAVVALAGWREPILHGAASEKLRPTMKKLCAANEGKPFALLAGTFRGEVLRVRCPSGDSKWEKLD